MKTIKTIAALAALAMVSCTKTDEVSNASQIEIGFGAQMAKPTKAAIDNGIYPTTEKFGVFAYALTNNKKWASDKASAATLMNNVEISYQSNVWKATTGKYYWPNDPKSSVTFIAYSPKNFTGEEKPIPASYSIANSDGLTFTDFQTDAETDLMYADEMKDKLGPYQGGMNVTFKHALTNIFFSAETDQPYPGITYTIKSIKLKDVFTKGTFKALPTPTWALASSTDDFEPYSGSGVVVTSTNTGKIGADLMMMPQDASAATIEVVYTISGTNVATETVTSVLELTGHRWEINQRIEYVILIEMSEIIYNPKVTIYINV
ncbi:hypothetical protein BN938_2969 [Mucinivorans hirudinis]|uniref:Fimbrillin family protein n=1 Tax=Mucinivorans hirudinis TaxID=1433126 RepID=A0A060REU7_9BACT|nr:hypothetical protein BN938_2969 [Mucinivorans hirudinis]